MDQNGQGRRSSAALLAPVAVVVVVGVLVLIGWVVIRTSETDARFAPDTTYRSQPDEEAFCRRMSYRSVQSLLEQAPEMADTPTGGRGSNQAESMAVIFLSTMTDAMNPAPPHLADEAQLVHEALTGAVHDQQPIGDDVRAAADALDAHAESECPEPEMVPGDPATSTTS